MLDVICHLPSTDFSILLSNRSNERKISNQETFFRNLKKELCLFFCPDPLIIFKSHPSHLDVECAFWHFFFTFLLFLLFWLNNLLGHKNHLLWLRLIFPTSFFFLSFYVFLFFLVCFSVYLLFFLSILDFFLSFYVFFYLKRILSR